MAAYRRPHRETARHSRHLRALVRAGDHLLFDPTGTSKQNMMLTRLAKLYTNNEVLKIATSGNCELFALSGPRDPYGEAKLGVLKEGAWADMLLVNGDPTKDIKNTLNEPATRLRGLSIPPRPGEGTHPIAKQRRDGRAK
jgi:imidazolonepropionase-like amidohydrolase